MSTVSESIKRLRAQNNMTQEELAEKMHVTRQAVSNWETEKTQPDIDTLNTLADVFNVDVSELIYGNRKVDYQRFQKRYIWTIVVFAIVIMAVVIAYAFLIPYWKQLRNKYIILASSIILPLIFEALIAFSLGIIDLSAISLFADCHIKRKALMCILGIVMLVPLFTCIIEFVLLYYTHLEVNHRILLYYVLRDWHGWISVVLIWILPHIAGIFSFLFFNKQKHPEQ